MGGVRLGWRATRELSGLTSAGEVTGRPAEVENETNHHVDRIAASLPDRGYDQLHELAIAKVDVEVIGGWQLQRLQPHDVYSNRAPSKSTMKTRSTDTEVRAILQ